MRVRHVKDYGSEVYLADGEELHINYIDELADTGKRSLERCADCGALMLVQELFCGGTFVMDGPFYGYDFIPVQSEEEADLLNILLDGDEFCEYPVRHIRARDSFMWWVGEGEPRPNDPEELKEKIRNKYHVTIEEKPVVTTNTDGSEQESGRKEYILKSIHGSAKKVKKGRRNLLGEERRRSREQIMGYIRFKGREGAQMKDICGVFQEYTPTQIRGLVRELNDENQIYLEGQSHNARWVEIKYKRYKALRDAAAEGKKRR